MAKTNLKMNEKIRFTGYEIKEILLKEWDTSIKGIMTFEGAKFVRYSPYDAGLEEVLAQNDIYDFGKKPYQPKSPTGEEWPPHWALARLDCSSEKEILQFVNLWGPLEILAINPKHRQRYSCGKVGSIDFCDWDFVNYLNDNIFWDSPVVDYEPLDSFILAAKEYQEAVNILKQLQDMPGSSREANSLRVKFLQIAQPHINSVSHGITFDKETNKPQIYWNFPYLLAACYFRLIQNRDGSTPLQACERENCRRLFQAKNKDDKFCSRECRNAHNVSMQPKRRAKRKLRELEIEGHISKQIRWSGGKKVDELYNSGITDYDTLWAAVCEFIGLPEK